MIPIMIFFGLVFGRWWRAALAVSAVAWPLLLLAAGVTEAVATLASAAVLAVANASVGVLAHQGLLRLTRVGFRTASARQ